MDLVIDEWEILKCGTLSDTTELVVDGTVAQADPTFVSTEVRYGNATQMSANSGSDVDGGVTSVGNLSFRLLIQLSGLGKSVSLLDLRGGQTSNEDHFTIPGSLEDFTRGELSNVQFLVGVFNVSVSSDHLLIEAGNKGLDTEHVRRDDETLNHVHLGTFNFVVFVLFVPKSVLIEPVVSLGLGVNGITEVARSARGNPVVRSIGHQKVISQLLVLSVVIVLQDSEVSLASNGKLLVALDS
mmetsp:Transcript_6205/g.4387  ORF Transcript_6205/g.4387 Transcript_6205/m.4387 type:complete len:241 (+) Transcript_6205:169-891(+)|eukprot:CAMPEP_0116873632 /NCGR_PEP_ID=MMETSP0463-20121206/4862_1 /TAXON_ID=181622 /ORGANISM="Strombidinopsis sp, Strain SopsisLIS2011" /LENGTH=240 /DNA_ID=CAMNT_0004516007 /DNA_START=162 /DNA_END=884 /DNA_ORIENTATION=+